MDLDADSKENDERWRSEGLLNIKPHSLRFGEFPEGWDVVAALKRHIGSLAHRRIVEFGCGYGRLCRAFDPDKYFGLDINESAIEAARAAHPGYSFRTISYVDKYPPADTYLAYTVFLHISQPTLNEILERICRIATWVVIAEILGGKGLDQGEHCAFRPHAVYNRTKPEYERLLEAFDFTCWEEIRKKYYFYEGAEISILIFRRKDPPPGWVEFPGALGNADLEFAGIYEDGWAQRTFSVRLSRPEDGRFLRIGGMLPVIDPQVSGSRLDVCIEGQREQAFDLPVGDFQLSMPVDTPLRRPRITVTCSVLQLLPSGDSREISFLLKSVGFTNAEIL